MPGYDGRGPIWGGGPGAGRGMGPCGVGGGWGRNFGRGWRQGFARWFGSGRWTKQDELKALGEEEAIIKQELDEIQKAKRELQSADK